MKEGPLMPEAEKSPLDLDAIKKKLAIQLRVSNWILAIGFVATIYLIFFSKELIGLSMILVIAICGFAREVYLRQQVKANPALAPVVREARQIANQNKKNSIHATYLAGLEKHGLSGTYLFSARDDGLRLTKGGEDIVFAWKDLVEVEAGSEDELRKRVTVSRVMLLGVFALALQKERPKDFYVYVATEDSLGLFEVKINGKRNRVLEKQTRVLTVACNSRIMAAHPGDRKQKVMPSEPDAFERIEKLGDLLSRGLITQSEFDREKSEILRL